MDKNNIAPRTGFAYALNDRTVIRGGYGHVLPAHDVQHGVRRSRTAASMPTRSRSRRRRTIAMAVQQPDDSRLDPFLLTFPVVNRALLDQMFPRGRVQKNTGTIRWDDPSRRSPYTHQSSIGFERQLGSTMSASVDYTAQGAARPARAGRSQSAASPQHDAERHGRSSADAGVRVWRRDVAQPGLAGHRSGGRVVQQALQQPVLVPRLPTRGRTAGATSRTTTSRARSSSSRI